MPDWGAGQTLMDALATYRQARVAFLEAICCRPGSMRDPLAEFAELLVAAMTGDTPASNPVQKGWDLRSDVGRTTQVRYVANPKGNWVNWHVVAFTPDLDRYALVVYESLEPLAVLIFERDTLGRVGALLGKRHGNQDTTLQVTEANVRRLVAERETFAPLGVEVYPRLPTG